MRQKSISKSVPMKVKIKVEYGNGFTFKETTRFFGLLKDNREIDGKRVDLFVAKIEEDRYYEAYPIMCYEAANLAAFDKEITDFDGKRIPTDKLADYLVVLDGQHRVAAFIRYNEKYPNQSKAVPNVNIIKAYSADDVLNFLVAINIAGKDWNDSDRWKIARNVSNESVEKIIGVIKKYGFKHSTAQKIYLNKRLSKKDFTSFLDGNVSIIDDTNNERIEIGDKFVAACLELSEEDEKKMKLFSKRYFIDGFDDFSKGKSFEKVFESMKKLNYEDLNKVSSTEDFVLMLKKNY